MSIKEQQPKLHTRILAESEISKDLLMTIELERNKILRSIAARTFTKQHDYSSVQTHHQLALTSS